MLWQARQGLISGRGALDATPAGGNAFTLIANTALASNTAPATSSAIDTTGANLLVFAVAYYAGASPPTVSDSKTNTWTGLTAQVGNSIAGIRIFYCAPTSVGSGHTFTVSASTAFVLGVQAWSGANATPFDVQNGAGGSAITSLQPGSVTPNNANSLIIAATCPADNTSSYTINSGFTSTANISWAGGTNEGLLLAYLKQNAAAAINPTTSWVTSGNAAAAIAVFKP